MDREQHLEVISSWKQHSDTIESFIRKQASICAPLAILEAGCGTGWLFRLEGIQYILTGVDTDKKALEIRKNTISDLHEVIEGDLRSVDICSDRFDVIYCAYVLEHIREADIVIKNFVKWVKKDGIIIIIIPDRDTVGGYITHYATLVSYFLLPLCRKKQDCWATWFSSISDVLPSNCFT